VVLHSRGRHNHSHDHDHHHHDHDHEHHDHDHGDDKATARKSGGGGGCCSHGHHHHHADAEASPLLRPLARLGVFRLAEELESRTGYSVAAGIALLLSVALRAWAGSAPDADGGMAAAITAAHTDPHHHYQLLPKSLAAALPPLTAAAREILHRLATASLGVVFFLTGVPQLAETAAAAVAGRLDTHVLMSLSAVGTALMGMPAEGALLLLLFRASHVLEDRLTARARGSLERLLDSVPQRATRVAVDPATGAPEASTAAECAASDVRVGEHVLVRPGEAVPLDGAVAWGAASVSMQHISGESKPVRASRRGQEVPAGSLATDGLLVLCVTATSEDSTPARMARMAADAQAARPKLQRQLDAAGEVWTRAALLATAATALLLPLLCGVPFFGERGALYRAMGVLTAGSPCALAVVPLAYAAAIAAVASRGVLVRSGAALDALGRVSTVALDKTGTLTSGALSLAEGYELTGLGGGLVGAGAAGGQLSARRLSAEALAEAAASSSEQEEEQAGEQELPLHVVAVRCAAALSSLSNHPVSRAMAQAGAGGREAAAARSGGGGSNNGSSPNNSSDTDVDVAAFAQVPGSGVVGVCRVGPQGRPVVVRFGALDWVCSESIDDAAAAGAGASASARTALASFAAEQQSRPSRAVSFVTVQRVDLEAEGIGADAAPAALAAWWEGRARGGSSSSGGGVLPAGLTTRPLSPASAVSAGLPAVEPGLPASISMLCFEDAVQPGAREAVRDLRSGAWAAVPRGKSLLPDWIPRGRPRVPLRVVMLTGDNGRVAHAVARAVGIDDVRAELRPEDKLAYVEGARIKKEEVDGKEKDDEEATVVGGRRRRGLLMAGDGINDAPALAAADVGVAIASAPSDMVACAADYIVLNGKGVSNIPWLMRVAERTRRVVAQNLALAVLSVAVSAVPAAAGALPLWLAVSLHEGATLLVALNSLRVLLTRDSGPKEAEVGREEAAEEEGGATAGAAATTRTAREAGGEAGAAAGVRTVTPAVVVA
jgi:cation transport ATPase